MSHVDSLTEPDVVAQPKAASLGRRALPILRNYALVGLLIALIILFSILSPHFLTARNWTSLFSTQVVDASVALAILLPLIAGEFDLSVGYVLGFLAVLGAYLGGHGGSLPLVLLAMIAAGAAIGAVNGILTVPLQINSFISTLGVGLLISGFTLGLSGGAVIFTGIPEDLVRFQQSKPLGVNPGVFIILGLAIVLFYVLEHTPTGSRLYATGASARVSRLAGLGVSRLKIGTFVASGLLVGLGSILQLGQAGTASPTFGPDLLLPGYAAAFLGATCHRPGRFNVVGTIVALLLLAVGFNGLSLLGVPAWAEPVFNGVILLAAVLITSKRARTVQVG
jgi:ribose transport system permease protein